MIGVYIQILNLLYAPRVSDAVVFYIFGLLAGYSLNVVHDRIFDLLYDYLGTTKTGIIKLVRTICENEIRNYDRNLRDD